jgi:hypothetical protein
MGGDGGLIWELLDWHVHQAYPSILFISIGAIRVAVIWYCVSVCMFSCIGLDCAFSVFFVLAWYYTWAGNLYVVLTRSSYASFMAHM